MSFNINLWTFNKRANSTKLPTDAAVVVSGQLMDNCDVVSPSIRINRGLTSNLHLAYNYCYIQEFNRRYWITSWEWQAPHWIMNCTVDVLGTYKTEIGQSAHYVLRSASSYDMSVQDNFYPAKPNITANYVSSTNPWSVDNSNEVDFTDGVYVVGVINKDARFGTVDYYAISYSNMPAFAAALMSTISDNVNGFTANDASIALQRSLVDPMQFIRSCMYFPISWATALNNGWLAAAPSGTMTIFDWIVTIPCRRLVAFTGTMSVDFDTLPNHPQVSRGNWLNAAPYSNYYMWLPPFGNIQLDADVIAHNMSVKANIHIDFITGSGFAVIANKLTGQHMYKVNGQIGIPFQLSQITRDYVGAATSAIGGIASLFTGNFLGAASSVGNAINSARPTVSSVGTTGGFADYCYQPRVYCEHRSLVNEDLAEHGRPLCALATIGSLSGYVLCENASMTISGTARESEMVNDFLNGGFFYE